MLKVDNHEIKYKLIAMNFAPLITTHKPFKVTHVLIIINNIKYSKLHLDKQLLNRVMSASH